MARGVQLQSLVRKLRAEIGQSTNTSLGLTELDELQQLIRRTQEVLYDDYDWDHLQVRADKATAAGQRYYDFPTNLNLERIVYAHQLWSGRYEPLEYGIDATSTYNIHNSDLDERVDPAMRWSIYSPTQYEIWPMPATITTIRFTGTQKLGPLISDSDTADLDDILIVLFAAAEKRAGKPDGLVKGKAAVARLNKLKGRMQKTESFRIGSDQQATRRHQTVIRIAGT